MRKRDAFPGRESDEVEIVHQAGSHRYRLDLVSPHGRCKLSDHADWFDAKVAAEDAESMGLTVRWPR